MSAELGPEEVPPTCRRCGRPAWGWPIVPGDYCSPASSVHCVRSPFVVLAENVGAEEVAA